MPALCPDFLIETYLDHQVRYSLLPSLVLTDNRHFKGEQFCLKYDANSLIYISKAMDLFDMSYPALEALQIKPLPGPSQITSSTEQVRKTSHSKSYPPPANPPSHLPDLAAGMAPLKDIPILVLGVQSDILFTVEQQREIADALRMAGNENVSYYELGGVWGHDTFL
jgi:homoserine O-acetyltransferase